MLDRAFAFMGHARDHLDRDRDDPRERLHLLFPGDELSVRDALKTAMAAFRAMDVGPELRGVVEIVLAEVLNNVVEHAYAENRRGLIEVQADRVGNALEFRVLDDGQPMPGGCAPEGRPHDLDVTLGDLPEGGFGWALIRELTEGLTYLRSGNRNELRFAMPLHRALFAD